MFGSPVCYASVSLVRCVGSVLFSDNKSNAKYPTDDEDLEVVLGLVVEEELQVVLQVLEAFEVVDGEADDARFDVGKLPKWLK